MTPLQTAAQAVIDRWNLPAFTTAGDIAALEKALEAEQAQAVEPVAKPEHKPDWSAA